MRLSLIRWWPAFFTLLFSVGANAVLNPISTLNSSARGLGMGDAFTALSNDDSALFYNPAGLVRVRGLNLKLFGVRVGVSGLDAYQSVQGLQTNTASGFADAIDEIYGESVGVKAAGEAAFTTPFFGFAAYNHADTLLQINNPVFPEVYANIINDYGYVMGLGLPIGPLIHTGLNLRYVKRTGARENFGATNIADLDSADLTARVTNWGKGYGADAGVNLVVPLPFFSATVSAVWKNIGQTVFRSPDPDVEIPFEDNDITLGVGLAFETPLLSIAPAVDVRRLNDTNVQITRKLNLGVEVGLPLLDIRGGFHEGYYTYGLGVNLGVLRVDAATYGVELGAYPGQMEDRRYLVEVTMDLGVGWFGYSGGASKDSGSGSGKSNSKSIWGGRRLKQRR